MKKWNDDDLPETTFCTTHKGIGGGDLYAHQIAEAFDAVTDMRYVGTGIGRRFRKFYDFDHRFKHTGSYYEPEIMIGCSHFDIMTPIGKDRNIFVTFFPNKAHKNLSQPYDTIITCSEFSAVWVKKYWGKTAQVIYPHIDPDKFTMPSDGEEQGRKSILNVGRFFLEDSGHSKQQDVLLRAFEELSRKEDGWLLTLCGNTQGHTDEDFLQSLKDYSEAKGLNVEFKVNVENDELAILHRTHGHYWHSNGFKSHDPFETEHFGIVFVEALLTGSFIYPCKWGGWKDFYGASSEWDSIDGLVRSTLLNASSDFTYDLDRLNRRNYAIEKFSKEKMMYQVKGLVKK